MQCAPPRRRGRRGSELINPLISMACGHIYLVLCGLSASAVDFFSASEPSLAIVIPRLSGAIYSSFAPPGLPSSCIYNPGFASAHPGLFSRVPPGLTPQIKRRGHERDGHKPREGRQRVAGGERERTPGDKPESNEPRAGAKDRTDRCPTCSRSCTDN
jgi:hypothetical protein